MVNQMLWMSNDFVSKNNGNVNQEGAVRHIGWANFSMGVLRLSLLRCGKKLTYWQERAFKNRSVEFKV